MNQFNFTDQQVSMISTALVELPYRMAEPVIRSMNAQISANNKEKAEAEAEKKEEKEGKDSKK